MKTVKIQKKFSIKNGKSSAMKKEHGILQILSLMWIYYCRNFMKSIERMQQLLKVKNYSKNTIICYVKWMNSFFEKYKNKTDLGQQEINSFLTELRLRNM